MRSTKKITTKDANWDARLDSFNTNLKRAARRRLNRKTRRHQKKELDEIIATGADTYGSTQPF